ncbi:MAG: immunoglobulin domain-containing protein [Opitutaceae bacterium]|nr:immunoglobulin domain-containing protein [Verrucomicrobiales bacterium]
MSNASFFQAPDTSAIIEQTGGRLLVVGARNTNSSDSSKVHLIRYEPTGEIDSTFRAPLVASDSGSISRMAALQDGTILLGGTFTQFNGDPTNRYLTRIYGDPIAPTAPIIAHHPSDLSLLSGTNLTLSSIAAGTPPIQYQWLKQSLPITPGVRVSGDTNFVLSVSNLTRADSGLYRLMASNSIGMALSDPASVVVRSPQRILTPESLPDGSLRLRFADKDGSLAGVDDLTHFRVESSTNLIDWVSVTNTLSIGSTFLEIIDTNTVSRSASFYRVIEQ